MCIKATDLWLCGHITDKYTDLCLKVRLPQTRGTCVMSDKQCKRQGNCRKCALHFKKTRTVRNGAIDWRKERKIKREVNKLFEDDGPLEKEEEVKETPDPKDHVRDRSAEWKRP